MNTLLTEQNRLKNNMEQLQTINRKLGGSMDALRYDPDFLSVHARELGYGQKEERFIRIVGLQGSTQNRVAAGNFVRTVYSGGIEDKKIRIAALISGLFVFILTILHSFLKRKDS